MPKALITILGRSTWALVNSYYAILESGYYPDLVQVFAEDIYSDDVDKAVSGLKILSEEFGFSPEVKTEIVGEAEFIEAGLKLNSLIKELKQEGYTVAVDITPGRKALVAGALLPAEKLRVDHVFYLAVKDLGSKPYKMKPLKDQVLRDFIAEVRKR
ncbi:MAG: hypothetical protein ACLFVX_08645 [Archaeoglobaceae archaeon]